MRNSLRIGCLALAAIPAISLAAAAEDLSAELAAAGLAPTIARLEAIAAPGPSDLFALGGLRFLRTIEAGLQLRWAMNLSDSLDLPLLRLDIEENPDPAPFDPVVFATLFRTTASGMADARTALAAVPAGAEPVVELDLAAVWLDVNGNAVRDPDEGLLELVGSAFLPAGVPPTRSLPVRFDAADVAWLSAYTHLLEGVCDLVLTYDPTAAVTQVVESRIKLRAIAGETWESVESRGFGIDADAAFVIINALNQPPDADRSRAALTELRAMVSENRRFWTLVAGETDNDREWLPNDAQQSAIGITLPQGTGLVWQGVLNDLDHLLNGKLLFPHWRLEGAGLNVARMLSDPGPINLAGWIQGVDAAAYVETGPLITWDSWRAFQRMMDRNGVPVAAYLN